MIPNELRYTAEHEWISEAKDGERVRVGITDYAQGALGDIVFVQLPEVGATVEAGRPVGEVESTKSVSDVYAPVSGVVSARNEALDTAPELINSDPYGEGWMFEVIVEGELDDASLLDATAYAELIKSG